MALYSGLLAVALTVRVLIWIVPMLRAPREPGENAQRFGRVPAALVAAVQEQRVAWVHAVSVGEVLAASRLVLELEAALGEGWRVVISTTTRTGQALARERFGADRVFYMPLDFAFAVRPYLDALRPSVLVLMESEVWPRMMHECRKRSIPVIVVNARVSDRSFQRSLWVRWIWSRVLREATLWLAQSDEDARRLVAMGAPAADVRVGGNLKYDVRAPRQSRLAELLRELAQGRPIIVAGSTVAWKPAPEEQLLLTGAMQPLWSKLPSILLIMAPRHPERFEEAVQMASAIATTVRATDLLQREPATLSESIVVLDTIGDLAALYGIADVAFVGGSLVKRGGHNPLEPAQFAVPVVMGPSFENFRDIVGRMQAADAIRIVSDEAELGVAFEQMLTDPAGSKSLGERGRVFFEQQQGATARAVEAVLSLVKR